MQKVILITGVSSGIGKACAGYLAGLGHKVYGTSRRNTSDTLPYEVLLMDVTNKSSIQQVIQTVILKEKRIDVLINNAGMGIAGSIEDYTDEEIDLQFRTNFFGTLHVCRAVIPFMREQRSGLIINTSSLGGLAGLPFQGMYSATKFAIEGMSEALRMELKQFGIKVVLINPGDFKTNFTSNRVLASRHNDSPYKEQFEKSLGILENDENIGSDPIKIAKKIEKIINKKSPKVRYLIGGLDQVLFLRSRGILPSKWFASVMASHYKV
jgi:NAD(P)-dependent dehydrogenase (short-subunit alcohol dehydrogenase family)